MSFSEKLNDYMDKYGISGKDLSKASGLSDSTVSRFRTGNCVPEKDSAQIKAVAKGLSVLTHRDYSEVYKSMNDFLVANTQKIDSSIFAANLNRLISFLNINTSKLAKYLNYDPSYISKIRKGQRLPSSPSEFTQEMVQFLLVYYSDAQSLEIMETLLSCDRQIFENRESYYQELIKWLVFNQREQNTSVTKFLKYLSSFDGRVYCRSS